MKFYMHWRKKILVIKYTLILKTGDYDDDDYDEVTTFVNLH